MWISPCTFCNALVTRINHNVLGPRIILQIVVTSPRRSWYHFLFVCAEIQSRQRLSAYATV